MKKAWLLGLFIGLGCQNILAVELVNPALPQIPVVEMSETDYFGIVNQTGGYVNQPLHQAFWQLLEGKYSPEQRAHMVSDIQQALDILKAFQIQLWESAKTSYFSKQIRVSTQYTPLKAKLLQLTSPYFSPQTLVMNAEKIIEAAANRQAIDLGAGKYYITPELIEENLIGMRGSYERLKLLMTPEWKGEYKEYPLSKLAVTLLNYYAPDEYEESISQDDEKLNLHIAQFNADLNSQYEIGAVEYQKGNKSFVHFTPQERETYLQEFVNEQFAGYKVATPHMSKGLWRGHAFAKGISAYQNFHVIVMCFFVGDKAIYLKQVTDADLSNASTAFNDFTKRIQIMESKTPGPGGAVRTFTRVTS